MVVGCLLNLVIIRPHRIIQDKHIDSNRRLVILKDLVAPSPPNRALRRHNRHQNVSLWSSSSRLASKSRTVCMIFLLFGPPRFWTHAVQLMVSCLFCAENYFYTCENPQTKPVVSRAALCSLNVHQIICRLGLHGLESWTFCEGDGKERKPSRRRRIEKSRGRAGNESRRRGVVRKGNRPNFLVISTPLSNFVGRGHN